MVDSVLVLPPGFRVTDGNDNPVNNAKIKFREAGPGPTKTVYSDANLSVALGHTVRTRADGQPVVSEGSSTTVLIYVGPEFYNIEITDQNDAVIIPAKDQVKGAAVLSPAAPSTPPIPVITTGSPLTLTAAHKGNLINANGNTLTFTAATTLGDGWHVYVRNNGASGQVILSAASGISFEGQSFTARALLIGEGMHIGCDGTAFRVISHTPPLLSSQGPSVIQIVDRVSAAPGSPTPGARYIVSASFGSFTTHQIIEWNGAAFNIYTPPTNCGWLAYVQDESIYYVFVGSAWLPFLGPISALTEETAVDGAADFVPFYDTSATMPRKGKPQNLKQAGGLQLLNSGTVTNAASLDVVLTGYTGYRALVFVLSRFVPVNDDVELWMRFSTDGGSNYDATGYRFALDGINSAGGAADYVSAAANQILVAGDTSAGGSVSNVANEGGADIEVVLHNQAAARWTKARISTAYVRADMQIVEQHGGGFREAVQDTDAVRFLCETGNISSLDWAVYGLI